MNLEKRVPVQANKQLGKPAGTLAWWEHVKAWEAYEQRYHTGQSAERIAERGGFCYGELTDFLGHEPETWIQMKVVTSFAPVTGS
jgi:hypothetical protein